MEVGLYGDYSVVGGASEGDEAFFFADDSENYEVIYDSGSVKISGNASYAAGDGMQGNVTVNGGSVEITGTSTSKKGLGVNSSNNHIKISGDGVLMLYGNRLAVNVKDTDVGATVQVSDDGSTYTDWDGTTALSTFNTDT